jgi:ADP-heptose:LPS heptosyltransferase
MKILVIKSYGIGNAIMASPMIRALNESGHEVHLLCDAGPLGGPVKALYEGWERLKSIREYNCTLASANETIKWYNEQNFEAVVHSFPADSLFSFLVPFIKCDYRKPLQIVSGWEKHESEYNMDLVKGLINPDLSDKILPEVPCRGELVEKIKDNLNLHSNNTIYVAVCPSYKHEGMWWKKNWGEANFAKLIDLFPPESHVILVGGKDDIAACNNIAMQTKRKTTNVAGMLNIKETTALFSFVDIVVANDCGPAHLAVAMDAPTFTIFGPTSIVKNRPLGNNSYVVATDIGCSPCQGTSNWNACKQPMCIQSITPEVVMKTINKYIFEETK